ncbi:MAG: hypothetical protein NTZ33_01085 [Bacteroidetes bacterium]|nr:hypothetical protein [Bacteroidota bacterium]
MKTKLKLLTLAIFAISIIIACKSNNNAKQAELLKLGIHTVVIQKVMNAGTYTYLQFNEIGNPKVKESDTIWGAISFADFKVGDTAYYKKGFPMNNFKSKELNREFKEVLFIDEMRKTADFVKKEIGQVPSHEFMNSSDTTMPTTGKPKVSKIEVKIDPIKGGISIADLFAKKASFGGKTVKIKGKVTKFSPDIMNKNWIHLQDGTESDGKFDLTITTDLATKVNVGDVITIEGKVALNKDLGYSYFYEVLVEEAKISK